MIQMTQAAAKQAGFGDLVVPSLVTGYFQGTLMNANGANIIIDSIVCNGRDWLGYLQSTPPGRGTLYGFKGNGVLYGDRFDIAAGEIYDDHRHFIGSGTISGRIIPKSQLANLAMAASGLTGLGSLIAGLGNIEGDVTAALKLPNVEPLNVVKQFWGSIQGRTWDQAMSAATARAKSKDWRSGDQNSKNDLITLLMSTAINAKVLYDAGDPKYADLLRTWQLVADQMHIKMASSDIDKIKSSASAEIAPVIIIAAVIAQTLIAISVIIALVWVASEVIDNILSKIECDRELIRLHTEYNNDVAAGNKDSSSRDKLLEAQANVASGCTKKQEPTSVWPYVAGAGILTTAILGVVYRREISSWIGRKTR